MEDLTQPGGDRAEGGSFDAGRQFDRAETLVDELAGEVDGRAVLKGDHHLGQAELGDRAELFETGQATDDLLDGEGDLRFHFLRRQRRRRGIDLHLDWRRVREGVDVNVAQGDHAHDSKGQGRSDHQRTVAQ